MRAYPIAAAAPFAMLLALAAPSAAFAQESAPPDTHTALAQMSETLADPEFQAQASVMAQVMMSTMLDLKVGPLAEAVQNMRRSEPGLDEDEPGEAAIDPDARLRDLAPGAEDLPEQIAERVPEAMNAMSGMSEGLQTMLPALMAMAEQMRGSFEGVRRSR